MLRFYVLGIFCVLSSNQSLVWNTFGPIEGETKQYFAVSDATVTLFAAWGPVIFLPCVPLMGWIEHTHGLHKLIRLGGLLMVLGTGARCFADRPSRVWLLHVGQIFNAAVGPIVMVLPAKISAMWFAPTERTTATTVGTYSNFVGVTLSFLTPSLVRKIGMMRFLYCECALAVCTFLPMIALLPSAPPVAASPSSSVKRSGMRASVCSLLRNSDFLLLSVSGGLVSGAFTGWNSVITQVVRAPPWRFTDDVGVTSWEQVWRSAAWMGFMSQLAAFCGGMVLGALADRLPAFKSIILSSYLLAALCVCWIALSVGNDAPASATSIFASYIIAAFLSNCSAPLIAELCVEVSFPSSEAASVGSLMLITNVSSFLVQVVGMLGFLDANASALNWAVVVACVLAMLLMIRFRERRERLEYDKLHGNDEPQNLINTYQPIP